MANEMKDHGKYLNVWQKQSDGSWKLRADTWNSDVNPMSMNQAGTKPKDDNK
jgi:ketosteroid isomerase-like protein